MCLCIHSCVHVFLCYRWIFMDLWGKFNLASVCVQRSIIDGVSIVLLCVFYLFMLINLVRSQHSSDITRGLHYSPYFLGGAIAIPKMLNDGVVEYEMAPCYLIKSQILICIMFIWFSRTCCYSLGTSNLILLAWYYALIKHAILGVSWSSTLTVVGMWFCFRECFISCQSNY